MAAVKAPRTPRICQLSSRANECGSNHDESRLKIRVVDIATLVVLKDNAQLNTTKKNAIIGDIACEINP